MIYYKYLYYERGSGIIEKIIIDAIEKNSKYKITHYDNRHFLIDLNRNKFTFVFPLLNYFSRPQLIEIDNEEVRKIKTAYISEEYKEKMDTATSWGTGIGLFIVFLTRSVVDYIDFPTNVFLNVFFLLISIIPLLILKGVIDRRKKNKFNIKIQEEIGRAFILPNPKEMFKNISLNVFSTFIFIALSIGALTIKEYSVIYIFGIMLFLSFILFQNVMLYNKTTIEGKMGSIK
ncbi:DUF443 family protein [Staphylococcus argensis]|nr:DUF443 family protein [Staphylococcus argensis]